MTAGRAGESGLQAERTSLAWNRTALTAAALGATTVRASITDRSTLHLIATGVSLGAAITMYVCSRWRRPSSRPGEAPAGRTAILIAAVSAVLAGLAATVVLVVDAARY